MANGTVSLSEEGLGPPVSVSVLQTSSEFLKVSALVRLPKPSDPRPTFGF